MRRLALAMALAALGLLVVQTPVQAKVHPRTVGIVGDSISYISAGTIGLEFEHHFWVEFNAGVGMPMSAMLPALKSLAATKPYALIVELGTNDAYGGNTNWSNDFVNEKNAVLSQRCVVFITVSPKLGPIATGINLSISNAARSNHRHFHVLDWGDIEFTDPSWVGADQIHPTAAGRTELATLELHAIQTHCRVA